MAKQDNKRIRWRGVMLPMEHGAWDLLLEPALLGMLVAPSFAGFYLSLALFCLFLARLPLVCWLGVALGRPDRRASGITLLWGLGWGGLAALALTLGLQGAGLKPLFPLAISAPLALLHVHRQLHRQARSLGAEVAGGLALASITPAIALAGGWSWGPALVLWLIPTLRNELSILYVRSRLRLARGHDASTADVLEAHGLAIVVMAGMAVAGWVPALAVLALAALSLRAFWGLRRRTGHPSPMRLGMMEVAHGVLYVLIITIGYRGGI